MVGEILFWLHIIIIAVSVAISVFLPVAIVLGLIIVHKLHLKFFGDCILTKLKRYTKTLKKHEDFLQYTIKKFLGKSISAKVSTNVNYSIYAAAILVSLVKYF